MRILIANDDGYLAPGLAALVEACEGLGELDVVAPEQNASGTSNSLTLNRGLSVYTAANGYRYINGTPSDCVHLALSGLLEHRPDLVVSGINKAPTWATTRSTRAPSPRRWKASCSAFRRSRSRRCKRAGRELDAAARVARSVIEHVLRDPPAAPHYLLNVNIPNRADADTLPRRITRLGRRHASEPVIRQVSPRGDTMYWIGPAGDAREAGAGHRLPRHRRTARSRSRRCTSTSPTTRRCRPGGAGSSRRPDDGATRPARKFPLALGRARRRGRRPPRRRRRAAAPPRPALIRPQRHVAAAHADAGRRAPAAGLGLDSADVRARMVERLRARRRRPSRACSPRSPPCRAICFVDAALATQAYEDTSLPIGHGQTISKPSVVARMLELLFGGANARAQPATSARVLEIGTGCGYQAALLAQLAQRVVSVERLKPLHDKARELLAPLRDDRLRLVFGDGMRGHPPGAPYDSIIAAAGGDDDARRPGSSSSPSAAGWSRRCSSRRGGQVLVVVDRHDRWLRPAASTRRCSSSP